MEDPEGYGEVEGGKEENHDDAKPWIDIGDAVKTITQTIVHVDEGVEHRNVSPKRREHFQVVENPSEERKRGDDKIWHQRQLFEGIGRQTDDEPEQCEGKGGDESEKKTKQWVLHGEIDIKQGNQKDDHRDDEGSGGCRQHVAQADFKIGEGCGQQFINHSSPFWEIDSA